MYSSIVVLAVSRPEPNAIPLTPEWTLAAQRSPDEIDSNFHFGHTCSTECDAAGQSSMSSAAVPPLPPSRPKHVALARKGDWNVQHPSMSMAMSISDSPPSARQASGPFMIVSRESNRSLRVTSFVPTTFFTPCRQPSMRPRASSTRPRLVTSCYNWRPCGPRRSPARRTLERPSIYTSPARTLSPGGLKERMSMVAGPKPSLWWCSLTAVGGTPINFETDGATRQKRKDSSYLLPCFLVT